MKVTSQKLFYTILLLMLSSIVLAQSGNQTGAVSGTLLDENSKPMGFATVSLLKAQDSTVVKGTLSNETGTYTFDHIAAGTYIIKATEVGYAKTISNAFTLVAGSLSFKVPALKMQQASHTLSAVNITASKPLIE